MSTAPTSSETVALSPALVASLQGYAEKRRLGLSEALSLLLLLGLEAADRTSTQEPRHHEQTDLLRRLEHLIDGMLGPCVLATVQILAGDPARRGAMSQDEFLSSAVVMGRAEWTTRVADSKAGGQE